MANRSEAEKNAAITALTLAASINPIVIHITDAIQHHGPFYALTALVESTIDVDACNTGVLENDNSQGLQATATNIVLPKGVTIYGNFTSIELDASGSVLAYAKPGTAVTVD